MIYLASPYTTPRDKKSLGSLDTQRLLETRYEQTVEALRLMLTESHQTAVFSPIVHTHEMAKKCNMPKDSQWWWDINKGYIDACKVLAVLTLPGWRESEGVTTEIQYAKEIGKPVVYVSVEKIIKVRNGQV